MVYLRIHRPHTIPMPDAIPTGIVTNVTSIFGIKPPFCELRSRETGFDPQKMVRAQSFCMVAGRLIRDATALAANSEAKVETHELWR